MKQQGYILYNIYIYQFVIIHIYILLLLSTCITTGMGGASSVVNSSIDEWKRDADLPADASDLGDDTAALRKEVVRLRAKISAELVKAEVINHDKNELYALVNQLQSAAVVGEKVVTPLLQAIASDAGGTLTGLQHKFKERKSLIIKIEGDLRSATRAANRKQDSFYQEVSMQKLVWQTGDALRYTLTIPAKRYCETVIKTRELIQEQGLKLLKMKNYWAPGDMYQGR